MNDRFKTYVTLQRVSSHDGRVVVVTGRPWHNLRCASFSWCFFFHTKKKMMLLSWQQYFKNFKMNTIISNMINNSIFKLPEYKWPLHLLVSFKSHIPVTIIEITSVTIISIDLVRTEMFLIYIKCTLMRCIYNMLYTRWLINRWRNLPYQQ